MPSQNTHYLLTRKVAYFLNHGHCYNQIKLDEDKVSLYGIGQDFTYPNPIFYKVHSESIECFLITLLQYIKKNQLENDPEVLAFLYGHIVHYMLDSTMHHNITTLEHECEKDNGIISNHQVIEWEIDAIILKSYHLTFNDMQGKYVYHNTSFLNQLINYLYEVVYGIKNVSIVYRKQGMFSSILQRLLSKLYNKKMDVKGIYRGLFNQKLLNRKDMTHDIALDRSIITSLNKAYELIELVNKYLYGYKKLDSILKYPLDITYDGEKILKK